MDDPQPSPKGSQSLRMPFIDWMAVGSGHFGAWSLRYSQSPGETRAYIAKPAAVVTPSTRVAAGPNGAGVYGHRSKRW